MPHAFRRTAVLMLLITGLLVPAATSEAGPARAAQDCAGADAMPTPGNEAEVRSAILCLHNQIRAQRGLPSLRENPKLRRAAEVHSTDMVEHGFFDHTTPAGVTMTARIKAVRYLSPEFGWAIGENLAWGTGSYATPRQIMQAWMDSPGHRANVVKRAYREIGIGIADGTPSAGGEGATYTADFGVVHR